MTNLHDKLIKESDHIRLTHAEKNAMRAALFGAPSPVRTVQSPYVFLSSNWMRAFAALLIVVFAGGGTAFASEGSLPGQPLYALKTQVIEPVQVALASTPAAKAAVHAQIAATRVAEAETLAQKGALDATTSAELADNYEQNAQSAIALADQASTTDPAASAEVKAQVAANGSAGSAVLVALADNHPDSEHAVALAARVLAMAVGAHDNGSGESHGNGPMRPAVAVATTAAVNPMAKASSAPAQGVRTFAAVSTSGASSTEEGSSNATAPAPAMAPASAKVTITAAGAVGQQTAMALELKAQDAISSLRAQFNQASSTLDASTTVSVQTQLGGIDALMQDGAQSLSDSIYDTALSDFTHALSQALRLSALLEARQHFNTNAIDSVFGQDNQTSQGSHDWGGNGAASSTPTRIIHGIFEQL